MDKVNGEVYGLFCGCPRCPEEEIRYVGVTVEGFKARLKKHVAESKTSSQRAKDRWIRKHGYENIRSVVLETVTTVEDLKIAETVWIERLSTYGTKRGLNMTRGGDGIWGYTFSEDVRERMRLRTAEQFKTGMPQAKIGPDQVREILDRLWAGESTASIARDYPVSASTVQKIRSGRLWSNIPRPEGEPLKAKAGGRRAPQLEDKEVANLRAESTGAWGELKILAEKYGLTESYVSLILSGRRR